jgi:hypothetical protein
MSILTTHSAGAATTTASPVGPAKAEDEGTNVSRWLVLDIVMPIHPAS